MALETRLLTGGINIDDADFSLKGNQILNSVNVKFTADGQQPLANAAHPIYGDAEVDAITTLLDINNPTFGTYKLIGQCSDEVGNQYLFLQNYPNPMTGLVPNSRVVKYNIYTDTATVLLAESWLPIGTGGFNWEDEIFIDCGVADGKLFWVDPIPRYIDLSIDYSAYTYLTQDVLSLIQNAGNNPILATRTTSADNTTVQFGAYQFTYRVLNKSGFWTVLAPLSLTSLPTRQSAFLANSQTGAAINLELNNNFQPPTDWSIVEFVVRDIQSNAYYSIKQWNEKVPADKVLVEAMWTGSSLTYNGWTGHTLYTIDATTAAKQFENIPLSAKSLAIIGNRLFLGDITEGYDTPINAPDVTITTFPNSIPEPTTTTTQTYITFALDNGTDNYYFAVILVDPNGKYRLLPKECSIGYVNSLYPAGGGTFNPHASSTNFGKIKTPLMALPKYVCWENLILLENQQDIKVGTYGNSTSAEMDANRRALINEANGVTTISPSSGWTCLQPYYNVEMYATSAYEFEDYPTNTVSRAFQPNTTYGLGFEWYDQFMRKCGRKDLSTLQVGYFDTTVREIIEYINVTVNNTGDTPPEFAHYYAVTLSANNKGKAINFVAGMMKLALINDSSQIKYANYFSQLTSGYRIYGTAIPLSDIVRYGYGYEAKQGDYVELMWEGNPPVKAEVLRSQDGYLIVTYIDPSTALYSINGVAFKSEGIGANSKVQLCYEYKDILNYSLIDTTDGNQKSVVCSLYGQNDNTEQFEVAKFGKIQNAGSIAAYYGDFYDGSGTTCAIFGDYHSQTRGSCAGTFTLPSYTPNEELSKFVVNDLGRICPLDIVGQQHIDGMFRWSNVNIPNAQYSGYATFDPLDYAQVDDLAGRIVRMIPVTKGVSEGGQLAILCYSNSFTTMISKSQIMSADQTTAALGASTKVVNDINPITGGWGCQSPRSAVYFKGRLFWADVISSVIVQFAANGAENIAEYGFNRGFIQLTKYIDTDLKRSRLSGAINGVSNEYILYVPTSNGVAKEMLPTTTIENPLDAVYYDDRAWVYNWDGKCWTGSWQTECQVLFNFEYEVYGWSDRLWQQFVSSINQFGGVVKPSIITVPFNQGYPIIKKPMSVRFSGSEAPDETYVVAEGMNNTTSFGKIGVAITGNYEYREGDYVAEILNDRLSNNATFATEYDRNNFSGERLRGKVPKVVMKWNNQQNFLVESVSIEAEVSSGQTKNK